MSDTPTFDLLVKVRPLPVGIALVVLLIAPLAGCTSPSGMKMSSKKVCESAGGTYSGLTCYPNVPKGAEQMCLAHGGMYLTSEDYCDFPIR
jgi:hypothetical protein